MPESEISDEFIILQVSNLTWVVFEGEGIKSDNLIIQDIYLFN